MSKDKLIPELRFPEFKNEGEWTETILGSVVEMKGRIGYRGYTTEDIVDKGKGAITLSPSNFKENGQLNFDKCTYISWAKYDESPEIQLEEGQTVLVKTASVGKTAYVDKLPEKATVNPQIVVLKPKTIHNRFLSFTVSHQNSQTQIRNNVGAGAIPNISQEIISKIKILIPPDKERKEQQKIASCLSSLDEVIAAHSQKLDLLKDHKKGLMQNLFPQEGETVPKYRFKEFEKDGVWLDKKLGDLGEFKNGINFTPEQRGTGTLTVDVLNMFGEGIEVKFNSLYRVNTNNGDYLLVEGDILFVRSSVKKDGVGWASLFKEYREPVIYCGFLIRLRITSTDSVMPEFLLHLLRSENKRRDIISLAGMAAITNISQDSLKSISINIPTKQEQQKIASCLSSLDDLITAQTDKINQLKYHKKGLMQGLFPKIND